MLFSKKRWSLRDNIPVRGKNNVKKWIFVFSSTHRAGSTLMQRVVNTHPNAHIWGETNVGPNLIKIREVFRQKESEGSSEDVRQKFVRGNRDAWTALMIPDYERLIAGFRAMLETMLGMDGKICGSKEVSYTRPILDLYKEVLPSAKYVLLVRNPLDVYLSLRRQSWWPSNRRTDSDVNKDVPRHIRMARGWAERTSGFLQFSQDNPSRSMLVTYESISVDACRKIFDFLDIEFDELAVKSVLGNRIGESREKVEISTEETEAIVNETAEVYQAVYGEKLVCNK